MSPATVAVVGAGGRGTGYARWALDHPDQLRVVAVAEPDEHRRTSLAGQHDIPAERTFADWRELADRPALADAVMICTPDALHVEPAVALAARGYHMLLEKPLATNWDDCRRVFEAVQDAGIMLAVGHVLRYTAYTRAIRQLVTDGAIGDLIGIERMEPVGYWHFAHSYVRGNWRNEAESSFMLLAKSCHDIDWLEHIAGGPARRVQSFGALRHFRPDHAPDGAGHRCLDCSAEPDCPYSAIKIYLRRAEMAQFGWPVDVLTPDRTVEGVRRAIADGPYGRCVYHCDNDVVDHQTVQIEYADGKTASLTVSAFTEMAGRQTRLFGTRGRLVGDGRYIRHYDFLTDALREIDTAAEQPGIPGGHGGGDEGLMTAFAAALNTGDAGGILTGAAETLASHQTVFAAEQSRRQGRVVEI